MRDYVTRRDGISEDLDTLATEIARALMPSSEEHRVIMTRVMRHFGDRIAAAETRYARTAICAAIDAQARRQAKALGRRWEATPGGLRRSLYLAARRARSDLPVAASRALAADEPVPAAEPERGPPVAPGPDRPPSIRERLEHGERMSRRREAIRS